MRSLLTCSDLLILEFTKLSARRVRTRNRDGSIYFFGRGKVCVNSRRWAGARTRDIDIACADFEYAGLKCFLRARLMCDRVVCSHLHWFEARGVSHR